MNKVGFSLASSRGRGYLVTACVYAFWTLAVGLALALQWAHRGKPPSTQLAACFLIIGCGTSLARSSFKAFQNLNKKG